MRSYLNGKFVDADAAVVPVTDRGFMFGDGVYEVTRSAGGDLIELTRHVRRLTRNLREMAISLRESDVATMVDVSRTLLRDNRLDGDALVYWQVTRGAAPRVHQFPPVGTVPTVYVATMPVTLPHAVRTRGAVAITTPDIRWARCDVKTVNLLPNTLAKQRAVESGADEAIFVRDGTITEGASSNVFAVLDGELRTHPRSPYILPGVTRDVVLEVAGEAGMSVREEPFRPDDLARASELFFTSTFNDVMPIVRVDGRTIGSGRPGPVAQQLYAAFLERVSPVAAAP